VWSIGGPMRGGLGVGAAGICMPAMCVDAVVDWARPRCAP